jgi:hypothetical protein
MPLTSVDKRSNLPPPSLVRDSSVDRGKHKEKRRKSRVLIDLTGARRNDENTERKEAKEKGRVKERVKEWERERERLREMEKLAELVKDRDEEPVREEGDKTSLHVPMAREEQEKEQGPPGACVLRSTSRTLPDSTVASPSASGMFERP